MSPWWSLCTLYLSHARWSYRRRFRSLLLHASSLSAITSHCLLYFFMLSKIAFFCLSVSFSALYKIHTHIHMCLVCDLFNIQELHGNKYEWVNKTIPFFVCVCTYQQLGHLGWVNWSILSSVLQQSRTLPQAMTSTGFKNCLTVFLHIMRMSPWWSLCTLYLSHARWSYRRRFRSLLLHASSLSAITSHCLLYFFMLSKIAFFCLSVSFSALYKIHTCTYIHNMCLVCDLFNIQELHGNKSALLFTVMEDWWRLFELTVNYATWIVLWIHLFAFIVIIIISGITFLLCLIQIGSKHFQRPYINYI